MTGSLDELTYDLIGIGIGPSNLSLAALLEPFSNIRPLFLDAKPNFQWHPGLLLPNAALQVSFLKDLVTLVDPTSQFSFLTFLATRKRLYQFLNANFAQVHREEFKQYYEWVAQSLRSLRFGTKVESVTAKGGVLYVRSGKTTYATRRLVLGNGQVPNIPGCARPYLGSTIFHSSEFLAKELSPGGKRVLVIGGGQSGAEVVQHLLNQDKQLPDRLIWATRRYNYLPLEESSFTNELYTPEYSDYFYSLPQRRRIDLLNMQRLASDGVSASLIQAIYQRIYELTYLRSKQDFVELRPSRELLGIQPSHRNWSVTLSHVDREQGEELEVDIVVLCTGYTVERPHYLDDQIDMQWSSEGVDVNEDYSVSWSGSDTNAIYVQNAARGRRGIADPNLGLIPWRSATIANSVAGKSLYDVDTARGPIRWDADLDQYARDLPEMKVGAALG